MSKIDEQLEKLEFKIKQLARKVELIKEENITLVKENTELRELLDQNQLGKAQGLQTMEFEGTKSGDENKDKMRSALNTYIEEIDHCLELLGNI